MELPAESIRKLFGLRPLPMTGATVMNPPANAMILTISSLFGGEAHWDPPRAGWGGGGDS